MIDDLILDELKFIESTHTYLLHGIEIPSVTTVMKPLYDEIYKSIDENVMEVAANKGTEVHNAAENYLLFGIEDISEENTGYLIAFKKWVNDYQPDPIFTEKAIYHKTMMYAGKSDLVCRIAGRTVLVDYKSSSSVNYAVAGMQTEAYKKAFESHCFEIENHAILHLQNNGNYSFRNIVLPGTSWAAFGSLLIINNYIRNMRK